MICECIKNAEESPCGKYPQKRYKFENRFFFKNVSERAVINGDRYK